MVPESLNQRERRVLEAIVQNYVQTAEPVGSRTIARRFRLGVSAATIRNAMSDLEDKGYLFHPHTSAGRVPTDRAYRLYVDALMHEPRVSAREREALQDQLAAQGSAITEILRRAAEVLGVLTQELGIAVAPSLGDIVLERLDLVAVASDRLLLVLTLRSGIVRTIGWPASRCARSGRVSGTGSATLPRRLPRPSCSISSSRPASRSSTCRRPRGRTSCWATPPCSRSSRSSRRARRCVP
jgi:hypothetical protein